MVLETMDHQEYTWSETEYAIRDFIELYGKRLPQIVDVRHCYMGADNRLQTAARGKVGRGPHSAWVGGGIESCVRTDTDTVLGCHDTSQS